MARAIDVDQAKANLPDLLEEAGATGERIVLVRNGQPLAAVIGPEELRKLECLESRTVSGSLAEIAGQWEGFAEIQPYVEEAYEARGTGSERPVFLE